MISEIDGRALRGAIKRRLFLEHLRKGSSTRDARRALGWSSAAYRQARHRHPDWRARIDWLTNAP